MELIEKAAYIKGLVDGMGLDANDKTTKIINAIVDAIQDIAEDVSDLEQSYDDVCDDIDEIKDEVSILEDSVYSDYEDEDDYNEYYGAGSSCNCPSCEIADNDDEAGYEVTCPTCGNTIALGEDELLEGGIDCPKCGESLEFDYDEDESDNEASAEEK